MNRRVLVVCTANQCRSPMAEGLIRARIEARGLSDRVSVSSAGTWSIEGVPATPHAVTVMRRRGIDITTHRSRELDAGRVASADLILVMTTSHYQAILTEFPDSRARLHRFSALSGGEWDIADPVSGPVEEYEATARELERLIDAGWEMIVGGAGDRDGSA
jgi:protein-tyrosine-phosphatase